jgi:hypothetical protein
MVAAIVIAKEPRPGQVKTRLCPPCSPAEAARVAEAALHDTLDVVSLSRAPTRYLAVDGTFTRPGFRPIAQRGPGLAARLGNAFQDVGPAVLIGMDTPQVTTGNLEEALGLLARTDVDAVIGPTPDGGYWTIGLQDPNPDVFAGIPMSTPHTFEAQCERLRALGLRTAALRPMRDVDTFEDAVAVAAAIPRSRFARQVNAILDRVSVSA